MVLTPKFPGLIPADLGKMEVRYYIEEENGGLAGKRVDKLCRGKPVCPNQLPPKARREEIMDIFSI